MTDYIAEIQWREFGGRYGYPSKGRFLAHDGKTVTTFYVPFDENRKADIEQIKKLKAVYNLQYWTPIKDII